MDVSGSMLATDVEPTRLDAAKAAAGTFLDELPERFRVGLVSFSSSATVLASPTEDTDAVRAAVGSLRAEGGTALGEAILRAVELAPEPAGEGAASDGEQPLFSVLLLSDGANSTGIEPLDAVEQAREAGVAVYAVALGTDEGTVQVADDFGATRTVEVPPDRDTLRQVAEQTGGRYFEALTDAELQAVYEQIGSQVALEEEEREVTAAFAGAGAVLLLVGAAFSALWFGRIP
jgi:Ca-activated chloride channel homolog